MAKLTLADLRKMREEKQQAMEMRDASNKDVQVIVGMGTCGIACIISRMPLRLKSAMPVLMPVPI